MFYVGNWEFGPERLEFRMEQPLPQPLRVRHQHNRQFQCGGWTQLDDADKRALIEYLKTL